MSSSENLKNKTIKGVFWSLGEQFGRHGIGLAVTLILARLLTPSDYGLIGLTSLFLAIATAIIESGFRQALIRKVDLSQTEKSTVFFTNLSVSIILYILLFLFSPLIAVYFKEPRLTGLIRFIGIQLIIYAFQIVQVADLTRKMDFKTQVKVTLPSGIISGIIAILLAWNGFGVWSLAVQTVLVGFLTTVLYWIRNRWIPSFVFSFDCLRDFFSFSSKLLASSLLNTIFKNIYTFVIGSFFSTHELGFYSFSMKIKRISSEQITSALQKVSFPALAQIQDEEEKLKKGYRKIIQCSVLVIFNLMVVIAFISDPIFKLFLHNKWFPAIPYLRILCISGAIYPLSAINLNVLYVKGRSDLFLKLEIIKKVLTAIMLTITIHLGIFYLLTGQAVLSVLAYLINSHYNARLINYSVLNQFRDIFPSLISAVVVGISLYLLNILLPASDILRLICMTLASLIFFLISNLLVKNEAFFIIYHIIFEKINFSKRKLSTIQNGLYNEQ